MEILGIGPSELLFIIVIALIVLGPKDMQKAGRSIGKWLRQIVTSDGWKLFQQTSREIQTLPNRLMREAALEELNEIGKDRKQSPEVAHGSGASTTVAPQASPETGRPSEYENRILPAAAAQEPRPNGEDDNG